MLENDQETLLEKCCLLVAFPERHASIPTCLQKYMANKETANEGIRFGHKGISNGSLA